MSEGKTRNSAQWRTPTAIALATAIGVPVGVFLKLTAVPFGPVFLSLALALFGAVVGTAILCVLATNRYIAVGLAYAASVALTVVIASNATVGVEVGLFGSAAQFAVIFLIVGCVSLFGSLTCALLKWEDARARKLPK